MVLWFAVCFTRSKNFYCCRYSGLDWIVCVSRAQKISTVVDIGQFSVDHLVLRAQKISTVVDIGQFSVDHLVLRAQKISTVVDI